MFPRKERVEKAVFDTLLKSGSVVNSGNVSLRYLTQPSNSKNKYSFVVSGKVSKSAVERNLLKRRGRYVIRKNSDRIKTPFICVFFFKPGSVKLDYKTLEAEILNLLFKAKLI